MPPADPAIPASPPASAAVAGLTTHYVIPSSGPTVLWRRDAMRDVYLPAGQLVAFSPVQALSLVQQHGLVEIRLADGGSGFVDAGRLAPGDGLAAHRAYCAYNAGLAPQNGEVLARRGGGAARLEVSQSQRRARRGEAARCVGGGGSRGVRRARRHRQRDGPA